MTAPMVVTCARCLTTCDENDPAIRLAGSDPENDDYFCTDEPACDARMGDLIEEAQQR